MLHLRILIASLAVLLFGLSAAHAQVHVDAANTASGCAGATDSTGLDGSSWACAYVDLQRAIDSAGAGDEVWIAAGTYTPASASDSFAVTGADDGIELYGGFDGTESTRAARDPTANVTTLSGDVGGDDEPFAPNTNSDGNSNSAQMTDHLQGSNSNHVLYLDGTTDGPITNSTLIDGVTVRAGQTESNAAGDGGGLYCDGSGSGNECSPTLRRVLFTGNESWDAGGGIYADGGGGGAASPRIINSVLAYNAAVGGGVGQGGGLYNRGASPVLTNVVVYNNQAEATGGGLYNEGLNSAPASPTLTNVTFSINEANGDGGGIYNNGSAGQSAPQISNTILWGNVSDFNDNATPTSDAIFNDNASPTLTNTIIEGGVNGSGVDGSNNIDDGGNLAQDPQFLDPSSPAGADSVFGTRDDGLNPTTGSPALDAGDDAAISLPTDITGVTARRQDDDGDGIAAVDVGAYEGIPPTQILRVDVDAGSGGDGTSWSRAYGTLQAALDTATSDHEIWVAEGVYTPDSETDSLAFSGAKDGLKIYGGFDGTETTRSAREPSRHVTVLSGDWNGDDTRNPDGVTETPADISGSNSHHVLYLDGTTGGTITTSTVIDGVTVTGGDADRSGGFGRSGGGLFCGGSGSGNECSPTLRNVIFVGNRAESRGGAIYNNGFDGSSSPVITNAVFADNEASTDGGALFNDGENSGTSNPTITNATFTDNTAPSNGGVMFNNGLVTGNSSPQITNAILWGNSSGSDGDEIYNTNNASATLSHTIIQGGVNGSGVGGRNNTDGGNNLDQNPQFSQSNVPAGPDSTLGTADDGLIVEPGSPALDAGDGGAVSVGTDLKGDTRIQNGTVDLGAYEGAADPLLRTGNFPALNARNVDTSLAQITVSFNKAIDTSTVAPESLRVRGTQTGLIKEADDSVGASGTTLTYELARALQPGERVSVSVVPGISDVEGVPLDSSYVFDFTAQAGSGPATFPVDSTISTTSAQTAYPADLDGDGDLDVLSTSFALNEVAWYENTGRGEFSSRNVITTNASGAEWVYAADVDGDGAPDVLSASNDDNKIAWYENQIGESGADSDGFGTQQTITTQANGAEVVRAADLDGDGNVDVLSASQADNKIAWYENQIGESGADSDGFGAQQVITTNVDRAEAVSTADLDGDGALDVLSASQNDGRIAWYENQIGESGADSDGFGARQTITTAAVGQSALAADLDGDGDLDVIGGLTWYENQIGEGGADGDGFGAQQTIATNSDDAFVGWPADLDGDGDFDVLGSTPPTAWYENQIGESGADSDGFGAQQIVTTAGGKSAYAADLDGDGDLDALSVDGADNRILWHPNEQIAPQVVTEGASSVADSSFVAEAAVNPGGVSSTVEFQYGEDTNFGADSTVVASASPLVGEDTIAVSARVGDLDPGTTYHFRVRGSNSKGSTVGALRTVTTDISPPQVTTEAPLSLSDTSATLRGTVSPGGDSTRVYAALVDSTTGDSTFAPIDTLRTDLLATQDVRLSVDTLRPGRPYRYRVVAANGADSLAGSPRTFTTDNLELAVGRDTIRLGAQRLGLLGDTAAVVVENTGDVHITGLQATLEGGGAASFTLPGTTGPDSLLPGETRALDVAFRPAALGARRAALSVTAAEEVGARSTLTGRGVEVAVQAPPPDLNTEAPVDLTVEGGLLPEAGQATLFARPGGTDSYQTVPLQRDGSPADGAVDLSGTVPGDLVTAAGVDYYAVLSDGADTVAVPGRSPAAAARSPNHLPVTFETLPAQGPFAPQRYRMASVPARADEQGLKTVFRSSYGAYDREAWRLFRYDAPEDTYREFPALDTLRPGDGAWLVTAAGSTFSVPAGRTVDADEPYRIPLTEGWNQVGVPFGFAVPWDTIQAATGIPPADLDGPVAYGDTSRASSVDPAYQYDRPALRPWTGYFVRNGSGAPDTLVVPPVGDAAPASQAAPLRLAARSKTAADSGRYTLQVVASADDGTLRDGQTWIGFRPGAKAGRDRYDIAKAPPVRNRYVRVSARADAEGTVPHAASYRPPSENGQAWTLTVRARPGDDDATTPVRLRLREQGPRPEGFQRYVLDLDRRRMIPVERQQFSIDVRSGTTRRLRVIIGTHDYAQSKSDGIALEAFETGLSGNYPNPFAREAAIEYQLSRRQPVTLTIYNVLGQRIRTLVDEAQAAGPHVVTWEGENRYGTPVGSGVYFVRMRAGTFSDTRKMVLVR